MWFRKRKPDPAEVVHELREKVFSVAPGEVQVRPGPGHMRVWSVLFETGYPEAVASLVTVADGTTSMYFSNGGGIIGAGQHQTVRDAANLFIALVDAHVDELTATREHPLPAVGRVRFYARTFDGLFTAEADGESLGENGHALFPLFRAAHEVISAVRQASPER